ncbi:MAG: hypothetical protein ACR2OM_09025 [Aestuariivirgaceae bacterium]
MPEFIGSDNSIAVQMRLRDRQPKIAGSPGLVNGGRLLHFLAPDKTGWDTVRTLAEEDKLAGFPIVVEETAVGQIKEHLGGHWTTPVWHALLGSADQVLSACASVIDGAGLPDGWRAAMHDCPGEDEIAEIQALNAETGVSPYPAYYSRSEAVPVLTACLHDDRGALVATASVADRYHRDSRLGGHVFAGMVSVSDSCRGRGLGKLINALALSESHRRFGWTVATEQVAPDNPVSRAMILACGLDHSAGLVSVAAINSDENFTR